MSTKSKKYIFTILVCALLAVLTIIIIGYMEHSRQISSNSKNPVDLARLENNYKKNAKLIFNDFIQLTDGKDITLEQIKQIKARLLDLKVPADYKEFHIKLLLAIVKMENYLDNKNSTDKEESRKIISQTKLANPWINN